MHTLLIRRSALGDVLLTLPIACALPSPPTLLTSPACAPLLSRSPLLTAAITTPPPRSPTRTIDLHRLPTPPLDPLRRLLHRPTHLDGLHTIHRYAHAALLPPPPLPLPLDGPLLDLDPDRATDPPDVLRLGLVPAAAHATKAPPPELLAMAAAALATRLRRPIRPVLLAHARDAHAVHALLDALTPHHHPPNILLPDTRALTADLLTLAALTAGCDHVIGGDTGPLHLAQALDVPALILFGPTSPARWGPWRRTARALATPAPCRPCSGHGQRPCRLTHRACLTTTPLSALLNALSPPPP